MSDDKIEGVWKRARPSILHTRDYSTPEFYCNVPAGMPLEEMFRPDFWAHVAKLLLPHSTIIVDWDDRSRRVELFVYDVSRNAASVVVLHDHDIQGQIIARSADDTQYTVKWGGPTHKFRVIRDKDGAVMKSDLQTKDAAERWVKNTLQATAA